MFDFFRVGKFKEEIASLRMENESLANQFRQLEAISREFGALEAVDKQRRISELNDNLSQLDESRSKLQGEISLLNSQIEGLRSQLVVLDEELLLETFGFYKLKLPLLKSEDFKKHLLEIREKQKYLIKDGRATGYEALTFVGDEKAGRKLTADIQKLLIRAFNNECDVCVENVKFNNIESFEKRIEKSFESVNNIGKVMRARLSAEFKELKIQELRCAYEYQIVKQREKDELRKQREVLRDAQKAEKEIREAREAIEKERKHFATAIKTLEKRIESADDDSLRQELITQRESLCGKVADLDTQEKEIDYREKNAKAGFVYIVSNLGAFGENVYKIGMTRRLEPLERIDELGDASVPFEFDLHALVFSDDAPALEAKIHGHFETHRINKINRRKEFFKADLAEIERVVRENYDKVFELTYEATAEQYRESLRLQSP